MAGQHEKGNQDPHNQHLTVINQATLTPLVRRLLHSENLEVINWDHQQIYAGAGGGLLYRFTGNGRDGGKHVPWSLILKIIRSPGDNEPSDVRWKREPLVYQSGILDDLSGGLAVPRCLDITEQSENEIWMWLEEVIDELGQWPLQRYGLAAHHLGQFNGAYLTGKQIPTQPWVSQGWLRGWVAGGPASSMALLRRSLDHPMVRRIYPADTPERLFRLWEERETFFDALERLPQTFCHLDAFRRNLFAGRSAEGNEQTVAIDWAFTGKGAVGEEIAPLVTASLVFLEVDMIHAQELDNIVFNSYLDGLRDAGWHRDEQLVRLGYAAASALRFGFPILAEQVLGHSIGEASDCWVELRTFLLDMADEARELLNILR